jgi:hypothetical protein
MPRKKTEAEALVKNVVPHDTSAELVRALVQAIESTKPVEKKNAYNRKPGNPWVPKDGSPKLKLKRKFYQHGLLVDPDMSTNEEIELMNAVKPGRFLDGYVKVIRRRDKGIDIDYQVKTAAQRMKLAANFGINSFAALLERCIEEANNPTKYAIQDED